MIQASKIIGTVLATIGFIGAGVGMDVVFVALIFRKITHIRLTFDSSFKTVDNEVTKSKKKLSPTQVSNPQLHEQNPAS